MIKTKTSFPIFKPSITKSTKPIFTILEITYHTILPCTITYLIIQQNLPILFVLLLIPIMIRFRPEDI